MSRKIQILKDSTLLPEDRKALQKLRHIAHQVCNQHKLKLNLLGHRPKPSCTGIEGRCFYKEGVVTITIRKKKNGQWNDKPLGTDRILSILAHELAHLKHPDHSNWFRYFESVVYRDICKLVPDIFNGYVPGKLHKLYAG